jgi:uncharacterized protein YjbJ (UPF0337 family)
MGDGFERLKGLGKELAGGLTGHDDLKDEGREQQERAKEASADHEGDAPGDTEGLEGH